MLLMSQGNNLIISMIIRNRFDKSFGPFGSSAGFFMMTGGILAAFFSPYAIIIAVAGAFTAFTTTSTYIDTENRRIKHSDDLFGIIPAGKWIDIKPDMKLGLERFHSGYVGYTRANQPSEIHYREVRIFLFDAANKKIMPVKKCSSMETAKSELEELRNLPGLQLS